ncbi:MAG: toll/interleukin-1 receptor domain-containing protein, partial [Pseudonocardiaceae bacterium]
MEADGGIFVSYRREETEHVAGRIADRLIARFGESKVFMDVDSIPPGVDFIEAIQRAIRGCDVLL